MLGDRSRQWRNNWWDSKCRKEKSTPGKSASWSRQLTTWQPLKQRLVLSVYRGVNIWNITTLSLWVKPKLLLDIFLLEYLIKTLKQKPPETSSWTSFNKLKLLCEELILRAIASNVERLGPYTQMYSMNFKGWIDGAHISKWRPLPGSWAAPGIQSNLSRETVIFIGWGSQVGEPDHSNMADLFCGLYHFKPSFVSCLDIMWFEHPGEYMTLERKHIHTIGLHLLDFNQHKVGMPNEDHQQCDTFTLNLT